MNLGAGRVVLQDLLKVDKAVADGDLARSEALRAHIAALKTSGGTCPLMGLLSPGGVHAHQDHMAALATVVAKSRVPAARSSDSRCRKECVSPFKYRWAQS